MTTKMIRYLAGQYRLSPEKRGEILRNIYKNTGKSGIQALMRELNINSINSILKWIKYDSGNRNRCRRKQALLEIGGPPSPGLKDITIQDIFKETSFISNGVKIGKQGGRRSTFGGQVWDAVHGGLK